MDKPQDQRISNFKQVCAMKDENNVTIDDFVAQEFNHYGDKGTKVIVQHL